MKVRATRHNGRAGKNGVFTTKHNDRNFDLSHAKHIDPSRTVDNIYWDWKNGIRSDKEKKEFPTFDEEELAYYEMMYADFIRGQNARNARTRHSERNRTADELRKDRRFCPEESIIQFGREGQGATAEELMAIYEEYRQAFTEKFGSNVHMIDWAMHMDETTVHIQERHCFDYVNKYGEVELKQEKALEALGIPIVDPERPNSRFNNRKITFDAMNRLLLIDIAKKHGLDIEEQVKYGGKKHREKLDYIIASQMEKIAEQGIVIRNQEQRIEELSVIVAEKDEKVFALNDALERAGEALEEKNSRLQQVQDELEATEIKMTEVDSLIEEIADVAYEKAVMVVAVNVAKEAKMKADEEVKKEIAKAQTSNKLNIVTRGPVITWLTKVRERLSSLMTNVLSGITETMLKPAMRKAAKEKIRETSIDQVIQILKPHLEKQHVQHSQHNDGAR